MNNLERLQSFNDAINRALQIGIRDRQKLHYGISKDYVKKHKYMNGGKAPIDYLRGINPNTNKFNHVDYKGDFLEVVRNVDGVDNILFDKDIWRQKMYLANERGAEPRITKRVYKKRGSGNTIGDARFGGFACSQEQINAGVCSPSLASRYLEKQRSGTGNTIGDARFGGFLSNIYQNAQNSLEKAKKQGKRGGYANKSKIKPAMPPPPPPPQTYQPPQMTQEMRDFNNAAGIAQKIFNPSMW